MDWLKSRYLGMSYTVHLLTNVLVPWYALHMARFTALSVDYLQQIDQEIERLQQLREQVSATLESEAQVNTNAKRGVAPKKMGRPKSTKRGMSDAGRLAIAEAQRKRWAAKKAAEKKAARATATKKTSKKTAAKKAAAGTE